MRGLWLLPHAGDPGKNLQKEEVGGEVMNIGNCCDKEERMF
jgi:hypothetical protein